MKKLLLILVLLNSFLLPAQVKLSTDVRYGHAQYLSLQGGNLDVGVAVELLERIEWTVSYRIADMESKSNNQLVSNVSIDAISSFLSVFVVNNRFHNVSAGTGLSYYHFLRTYDNPPPGFHTKDYSSLSWSFWKLSYAFKPTKRLKIGVDYILHGDDGDSVSHLGLSAGYYIF